MINIRSAWARLLQYAKKRKEFIGIAVAVLILLVMPTALRGIDPTAAPLDPGVLSAIAYAVVAVLVFNSVGWWIIKTIWPVFCDYSENIFESNFKSLEKWQKVKVYLLFYSFQPLLFVLVLLAIL